MKFNGMIAGVFSLIIVIGGIFLNFQEFLIGSAASIKSFIVTFVYIIGWTLVILMVLKYKKFRVMKYYALFWIFTLSLALITLYVNVSETGDISFLLPLVILLMTQWYGIHFFIDSFVESSIIIAVISLLMVILTMMSVKKNKEFS